MNPALSVIIAAQQARETIAVYLDSLLRQETEHTIELIVVIGSDDATADLVAEKYPSVTLIRCSFPASLPLLLAAGIERAGGDIVAITEAHCTFPPDWAENVIAAHTKHPGPVIGGAVEPGRTLHSLSDWALYFADYGQFMLPLTPGAADEMPGENVSFKRAVLDTARQNHSQFITDGFWKTFFCQALQQTGHDLLSQPSIVIYYNRRLTTQAIIGRRWRHGRCFGGMRARQLSTPKRTLLVLLGFLLPPLLTYRTIRKIWPKNRYRNQFLKSFPVILLAALAWSAGEWWGTIFSTGNSCNYV